MQASQGRKAHTFAPVHAQSSPSLRRAAVAGDMSGTRAGMARKSWFGKDLAAAAQQAEEDSEDSQASNAWYNTLMGAVRQTVVISEILDSRTRNLISVGSFPCPPLTQPALSGQLP